MAIEFSELKLGRLIWGVGRTSLVSETVTFLYIFSLDDAFGRLFNHWYSVVCQPIVHSWG
jgi:hypothetical protein